MIPISLILTVLMLLMCGCSAPSNTPYIGVVDAGGFVRLHGQPLGFCTFDNQITIGDYVTESQTVAGECHDTGVQAKLEDR